VSRRPCWSWTTIEVDVPLANIAVVGEVRDREGLRTAPLVVHASAGRTETLTGGSDPSAKADAVVSP